MERPQFPQDFVQNGCPRVQSAKRRKDESPEDFAECAFHSAGVGLMCESCRLHLTYPYMIPNEKEYLQAIRKFYDDTKVWENLPEQKISERKQQIWRRIAAVECLRTNCKS